MEAHENGRLIRDHEKIFPDCICRSFKTACSHTPWHVMEPMPRQIRKREMQAHLGDLSNLALERADDLVSLGALHVLVVVASVEIAPVLGPVLLHNLLHSDQLSAATFVLMTRMQA